jgi:hypothetical protein
MRRNLTTEVVNKFYGLSLWQTAPTLGPQWAQDCINVIPNSSGGISKLRVPTSLSIVDSNLNDTGSIINFQNALGTRQVIAAVGDYVYRFSLDGYNSNLIDNDALNDAIMDFVQSNNIMFCANGLRMQKWTGTDWWKWGIDPPDVAPIVSLAAPTGSSNPSEAPRLDEHGIGGSGWTVPRTYTMVYTWVDVNGGETGASPPGSVTITDPLSTCRFRMPEDLYGEPFPERVVKAKLYVDTAGGTDYKYLPGNDMLRTDNWRLDDYPNWWTTVTAGQANPPTGNGSGTGRTFVTGRQYRVAYGNSATGHIGQASEASISTGAIESPQEVSIVVPNSTDPQVDQIFLFATEDGGGDYYLLPNPGTDTGAWAVDTGDTTTIIDGCADADLDKSKIAPLINCPAPLGKYVGKYQGRIYVAGNPTNKQDIYFTGYERIFLGRPEESFPPNNRLRLSIGSDEIRGFGSLQGGIVAFSKSNEMFMFRGSPEDVTVDAPIQYAATLEQLPYSEGCSSHYSIAETPYGLVWLGADKTIKVWNGQGPPQSLSGNLYPLLRRITEGQEENCRGMYFNWIEKEWYLLAIPIDDSAYLNRILVVDLEPDQEKNVGAFPLSIGRVDAMTIVEDANGHRDIVFLQGGAIWKLPTTSVTTIGLSA